MQKDKRKEERIPLIEGFKYLFFPSDEEKIEGHGISVNESSSGRSFFTFRGFREGSKLVIKESSSADNGKSAEVKWCEKISSDFFRIGLKFH